MVVSDDAVEELRAAAPEVFRVRASLELALALYQQGRVSAGRAMELAGLTRRELHEALKVRGLRVQAAPDHAVEEHAWAASAPADYQ